MKFWKFFFSANLLVFIILLSTGTHLTSCTKEIVHDTTIITDHDTTTINVHDTLTVIDTVCHINVGMVAHYTFNDGSLLDQSGHNNNITFNSATPTTGRAGTPNNAYLFNGSDSYMKVPNSESLNPSHAISMVAVIKANDFYTGTCHYSQIMGKGYPDPIQGFYSLRFTDPFGHCYELPEVTKEFFTAAYGNNIPEGNAAGLASDTSFINKDEWYVVIYTYDGTDSKMYVNGQLKAVQQKSTVFTANNHDLFIGKHEDPQFPYLFNGVMDELRIYDRALCSCEVEQLNYLGIQSDLSMAGF